MSEINKSYRIRTNVGSDSFIPLTIEQEYDVLDILSLKIRSKDTFKLHNSNVGIIVGRVQANNGFGIPNAKVSVFINSSSETNSILRTLYPYTSPASKNSDGVRYNLLPDEKVGDCHQVVGTFPNKRYVLDNDIILEVFDTYYKYTTQTNNSGDYMLVGVPTGNQIIHVDVDLSDCGILSQRPRDFVYKGYTVEQFENPNMFKSGTNYGNLSQIFTQNRNVYVYPYWGNQSLGEPIGLTRLDFDIEYKFEPTCVFIGSVISDNASQGITKRCIPTENMGNMDELVSGKGTIEMIRKTVGGGVEEFQVKGTELINGDGIWCYQIPMNLDYMMTDEYGNLVPTDNPERGIPTRTRVRFRVSMEDMEDNTNNFFRAKILVPHNPQNLDGSNHEEYDYEFGTYTKDESYRDLFWNNVYTVKSYIPRFQKRKVLGWKTKKFTGIKGCQNFGSNNPLPYNNIRIHLPLMFVVMCILLKVFIKLTSIFNYLIAGLGNGLAEVANGLFKLGWKNPARKLYNTARAFKLNVIEDGICPDLENWYFAPMIKNNIKTINVKEKLSEEDDDSFNILQNTLDALLSDDDPKDTKSIDNENADYEDESVCLTIETDYLVACMEMNLAMEYKVINFDFYNDWINGVLYFPRWMRNVRTKRTFRNDVTLIKTKIKSCSDDTSIFSRTRKYTQLCSLEYEKTPDSDYSMFSNVKIPLNNDKQIKRANKYHKKSGISQVNIFGRNGGLCHEHPTLIGQHVYYLKPCEWDTESVPKNRKINLFATDIVLLGSLNSCDLYGIPQSFRHLAGTTYIMPPNIALTNLETESALYTKNNGKICSKKNQTKTSAATISEINGSTENPLTAELNAYSGASKNYDVNFNDDENDTIALTEIAGIAWNYIGPGQGINVPNQLYYPGGHFLGLSCSNSQTNIKSCVNLERICEAGASMSQRKDNVIAFVNDEPKYIYTSPSGLISGGDIVDGDFRAMFATMNQKRLLATKLNKETGYLNYDFLFLKPNNFGGELNMYGSSNAYNKMIPVSDESATLAMFGIKNSSESQDVDLEESAYTQVKTIEQTSVDYYRFRFGLDYGNLTNRDGKHIRQFAGGSDGKYYLPQYENSFYFYFGLKAGATAIDEFNKEFFSECESSSLIEYEYGIVVTVGNYDFYEGNSLVHVVIRNMIPDFYYSVKTSYGETYLTGNTSDIEFNFPAVYGKYFILVRDSEGNEAIQDFSVGDEVEVGVLNVQNFTLPIENPYVRTISNRNLWFGGFVEISEATLSNEVEFISKELHIVEHGYNPETTYPSLVSTQINQEGHSVSYSTRKDLDLDVYIRYSCIQGVYKYILLQTVRIIDNSHIQLTIGSPLSYDFSLIDSAYSASWWDQSGFVGNVVSAPVSGWCIRNSIIKRTTSASTFDNQVSPSVGDKLLFGSLQNYHNVYIANNKQLYCNTYVENWEPGYSLDDEVSYHGTYGKQYTPDINQYNASVVSNYNVMGKWIAKFSGQTDTIKSVIIHFTNSNDLRDGGGCVVKSVTTPSVVCGVYRNNPPRVEPIGNDEELKNIDFGIVYPTVQYPVINRPFSVNTNYFYFTYKKIYQPQNGDIYLSMVDMDEFLEGRIVNGLTYKEYYSGKSTMTNANGYMEVVVEPTAEPDYNPKPLYGMSKFRLDDVNNMTGISETSVSNLVLYISGYSVFAKTDRKYNIIEGFPLHKVGSYIFPYSAETEGELYENADSFEEQAEVRKLTLTPTFFDEIEFAYNPNPRTIRFFGVGMSDPEIEYYYLNNGPFVGETTNHSMVQRWIYTTQNDTFNHFYVGIKYTRESAGWCVGNEGYISVYKETNHKRYTTHITIFPKDGPDEGTQVTFTMELDHYFDENDLDSLAARVWSETSGCARCIFNIEPSYLHRVMPAYDIGLYSFTSIILPRLTPNNKIEMNKDITTIPVYDPDYNMIIAIRRYNDEPLSTGNVCKIYGRLSERRFVNYE